MVLGLEGKGLGLSGAKTQNAKRCVLKRMFKTRMKRIVRRRHNAKTQVFKTHNAKRSNKTQVSQNAAQQHQQRMEM